MKSEAALIISTSGERWRSAKKRKLAQPPHELDRIQHSLRLELFALAYLALVFRDKVALGFLC